MTDTLDQPTITPSEATTTASVAPSLPQNITMAEQHQLEMARMNLTLAKTIAEKAIAENNSAHISYRYLLLLLNVKYGLDTSKDSIDEQGNILRGALPEQKEAL